MFEEDQRDVIVEVDAAAIGVATRIATSIT
jgi:hypothetical protein